MALAATLILMGGIRLAREVQEKRTPINSERFADFANAFQQETQRLETLYQQHLENLIPLAMSRRQDKVLTAMDEVAGVKLIRVFSPQGRDISIKQSLSTQIPDVEIEGRKLPLLPKKAFILPKKIFQETNSKSGWWFSEIKNDYRIYIQHSTPSGYPGSGLLVAILVNTAEISQSEKDHLKKWTEQLFLPIRGNNELLSITHTDGTIIRSSGDLPNAPPSAFIPVRTALSQWNLQTWDRISTTTHYDTGILTAASLSAVILFGMGILLFTQQKRALRLAAKRVSFVNRVSHELGTPLTSIRLNLDLTQDALPDQSHIARKRLKLVSEEVDRLSRLVINVLTFSQCERKTLEIKPSICSPGEIITQTLKTFQPALKRRGFEIQSSIAEFPPSLIDGDALTQIIGNLISNVEKYASSGAWLQLTCHASKEILTLEIQDCGPGIPPDKEDQIFLPFERIREDTSEGASGNGLGLSIARDLAEGMGGCLTLMPSQDGAHFRLQIPCPKAPLPIVQKEEPAI